MHTPPFSLPEAPTSQRPKCLRLDIGNRRGHSSAVARAVGVLEDESAGDAAAHDKLAAVAGAMMGSAQRDEIFGTVTARVFPRSNVMNVHEICVRAAWHLASMAVAS
jgi:hypothetical protein